MRTMLLRKRISNQSNKISNFNFNFIIIIQSMFSGRKVLLKFQFIMKFKLKIRAHFQEGRSWTLPWVVRRS